MGGFGSGGHNASGAASSDCTRPGFPLRSRTEATTVAVAYAIVQAAINADDRAS